MTPDILPADITGTHVYREPTGEFELQQGPVFANLVVADEINRATPKTQSALLEAMQEQTVTIEGDTLALPEPFMVIATQNPLEMEGVFELPEAQRDRFMLKLTVEIPDRDRERAILDRFDDEPDLGLADVDRVVTDDELRALNVHIDEKVREYILDIAEATRASADIEHGLSPRGSLAYQNASKARAAIHGRDYVIPDDVKALASPVLGHRLITSTDAELSGLSIDELIDQLVDSVSVPDGVDPEELADRPQA
jgi:MoxR-like ATPase